MTLFATGSVIFSWAFLYSSAPESVRDTCSPYHSYDAVMYYGLDAFYRSEWETAESCFEQMRQIDSEDPRGYFFSAMIPFWSYFFVDRSSETADRFLELSERAIDLAEMRLPETPDEILAISMLSGLHGYRSLVASRENRIRRAFQSGRTGFSYTRRLLELEETGPETDVGRGIYHYMAGSVPGSLRWLASIFGLSGSREAGFDYLRRASEADSFVAVDARMILAYLHNRDGDHRKALQYTARLVGDFEQNLIFIYKHADTLLESGRKEESACYYGKAAAREHAALSLLTESSRKKLEELEMAGYSCNYSE